MKVEIEILSTMRMGRGTEEARMPQRTPMKPIEAKTTTRIQSVDYERDDDYDKINKHKGDVKSEGVIGLKCDCTECGYV